MEDEDNDQILQTFGVVKHKSPSFAIYDMDSSTKYRTAKGRDDDLSPENIHKFVTEFFSGSLEVFLKSGHLPKDWNSGPVKVLVTNNFEEIITDTTKRVF